MDGHLPKPELVEMQACFMKDAVVGMSNDNLMEGHLPIHSHKFWSTELFHPGFASILKNTVTTGLKIMQEK